MDMDSNLGLASHDHAGRSGMIQMDMGQDYVSNAGQSAQRQKRRIQGIKC